MAEEKVVESRGNGRWRSSRTFEHLFCRCVAVYSFHVALVQRDDGAFQFQPGEQSFAARIGKNLRVEFLQSVRKRRRRQQPVQRCPSRPRLPPPE